MPRREGSVKERGERVRKERRREKKGTGGGVGRGKKKEEKGGRGWEEERGRGGKERERGGKEGRRGGREEERRGGEVGEERLTNRSWKLNDPWLTFITAQYTYQTLHYSGLLCHWRSPALPAASRWPHCDMTCKRGEEVHVRTCKAGE